MGEHTLAIAWPPKRLPWKSKSTIFLGFSFAKIIAFGTALSSIPGDYSFNVFWYAGLVNNVYIYNIVYIYIYTVYYIY